MPKALELSLSPAFYLTSPIDDSSQNVIYINRNPIYDNQPLYNTIAHEGYPGHLYQTVWFHTHCDSDLRKILSFSGYTEGWAAYVEALSYRLDNGLDPLLGELLEANSKATLGTHAYLDMAIITWAGNKKMFRNICPLTSAIRNPLQIPCLKP